MCIRCAWSSACRAHAQHICEVVGCSLVGEQVAGQTAGACAAWRLTVQPASDADDKHNWAHLSMGSRHDRLVLDLLLHDGEYWDRWMTCAGPRL